METRRGSPTGRRERWTAAALSGVLSLAGAECLSRSWFGVPLAERLPIVEVRANALRGYEMVPDRDHYTYEHPVHVNGLGLRGEDLPEKTGGEVRVLCLGDSLTYGQGIAGEDTLPVRLEHALAGGRGRVRVVNGGVRGYGTPEEVALLEELGPRIRPDVVVLLWYENDLERSEIEENFTRLERSGPVAFDTGAKMEGVPLWRWRFRQLLRRSALLVSSRHAWADWTAHRLTPAQVDVGFERLGRELDRLAEKARASGLDVLVAAIPAAMNLRETAEPDPLAKRVAASAKEHGFAFVDLGPDLRELQARLGRAPILPYDGHYTGEANAVMAGRIAEAILERFPGRF